MHSSTNCISYVVACVRVLLPLPELPRLVTVDEEKNTIPRARCSIKPRDTNS
jgi:hypothetical protein